MTVEELERLKYYEKAVEEAEGAKKGEIERRIREIKAYIDGVDDPFIYIAMRRRYIKGMSWDAVAMSLGGGNTADGVRMSVKRYIEKERP